MKSLAASALISLALAVPTAGVAAEDMRWKSIPLDDGTTAAYVEGSGTLRRLVLRCSRGKAEVYANTGTLRGEAPIALRLTGAQGGAQTVSLHRDRTTGQWTATLTDRGLVDLLQGHDTRLRSAIDERDAGTLSLGGSTAAIKAALKPCAGTLRAAPAVASGDDKPVRPVTVTRGKTSRDDDADALGAVSGPLPIKTGYYVARAETCTRPRATLFYDGKKLVLADGPDSFTATPATRFQKKRGDYSFAKLDLTLHVVAPDRVRNVDTDVTMRLCRDSEIPSKFKP